MSIKIFSSSNRLKAERLVQGDGGLVGGAHLQVNEGKAKCGRLPEKRLDNGSSQSLPAGGRVGGDVGDGALVGGVGHADVGQGVPVLVDGDVAYAVVAAQNPQRLLAPGFVGKAQLFQDGDVSKVRRVQRQNTHHSCSVSPSGRGSCSSSPNRRKTASSMATKRSV